MGYLIPRLAISLSKKNILAGSLLKSLHIKHFASHHFPKYFHIIKKWSLNIGLLSTRTLAFCNRFVMVVRKNVLEYIITLVVVKNKVRLKKCLKKIQIWQSSIIQINLSITSFKINTSFRRSMLISFWIDMTSTCTFLMS